jgi:predicted RNase H-like HicB family nuclease
MADSSKNTFPVVLRAGLDGWIVAECPILVGCISQGRNRQEALENIREAIELCLETEGPPATYELAQVTVAA